MAQSEDPDKRVIGLYGEMRLAMELHKRGWEVYRAYIDDRFDFAIMKTYCDDCKQFTSALQRQGRYGNSTRKVVTNLCDQCGEDTLRMLVRFIQVKTSEGVDKGKPGEREYSFHPKIRYHLADRRVFYVWIQVWDEDNINFYVFKTDDVSRFDDLTLASYQITDNQKTNLRIDAEGKVLTRSKRDTDKAFRDFLDNFEVFDELIEGDPDWVGL